MKLIFKFNLELIDQLPKKLQERYLVYFSKHENWWVRYKVAENPNTPVQTLEKLSEDEDSDVRYDVASNPNTPTHILEKLSGDEDGRVRNNATQNLGKNHEKSISI